MSKMLSAVLIFSGISLLFYFGGMIDSPNSLLLVALNPMGIISSTLWSKMVLALSGIGLVATVWIGIKTSRPELVVTGAATIYLGTMLLDFGQIAMLIYAENPVISVLIFGPVMIGLVMTLFDFWRAHD